MLRYCMPQFKVTVTIENKPGLSDPEGQTILKDLILKGGRDNIKDNNIEKNATTSDKISEIRTAKMLRFTIDASSEDAAKCNVKETCDTLHIYNPIVSTIHVSVESSENSNSD